MKKNAITFIFICVAIGVSLVVAGQYTLHTANTPSTPTVYQPSYTMDQEIKDMANELGINQSILSEAKPMWGDAAKSCNMQWVTGCYNGQIILTKEPDLDKRRVLLGHEYLHHVWQKKMSSSEQETVGNEASNFYNRYKYNVQPRMKHYLGSGFTEDSQGFKQELHSILCTEISDNILSPILLNHCKKWLPNRSALPSYF